MLTKKLTQIVPSLPPQTSGIGEYALHLALQLREAHGVETRFLVCDPDWDGPSRVEGFVVRRLRVRNEAGLWSLLAASKEPSSFALLHYSMREYDRLGLPLWLYRGIRSWLRAHPGGSARIFTVFHDLWSSCDEPWRVRFYVSLGQRWLAGRLHGLSRISVTGTLRMQRMLDQIEPQKALWLPMPSSLPAGHFPPRGGRGQGRLRVAVFEQAGSRCLAVKAHANLLRSLDGKGRLASVMLFGKGTGGSRRQSDDANLLQKSIAPDRIEVLGDLGNEAALDCLKRADVLLSGHAAEDACRSDAFVSALAVGCPAVLRDGRDSAPLQEGEHYLASDDSPLSVERFGLRASRGDLDRIAMAGWQWYSRHADWRILGREFRDALFSQGDSAVLPIEGEGTAESRFRPRPAGSRPVELTARGPSDPSNSAPAFLT